MPQKGHHLKINSQFWICAKYPRKLQPLTADSGQYPTEPIVAGKDDTFENEEKGTRVIGKNKEQRIYDQLDALFPRQVWDRDEY